MGFSPLDTFYSFMGVPSSPPLQRKNKDFVSVLFLLAPFNPAFLSASVTSILHYEGCPALAQKHEEFVRLLSIHRL